LGAFRRGGRAYREEGQREQHATLIAEFDGYVDAKVDAMVDGSSSIGKENLCR
jgi:hypothetical protein